MVDPGHRSVVEAGHQAVDWPHQVTTTEGRHHVANTDAPSRRCPGCGARLARDNGASLCRPCRRQALNRPALSGPPTLPDSFWGLDAMRQALATRHIGKIIRCYRVSVSRYSLTGSSLSQEVVGEWLGLSQTQLSRIENGDAVTDLSRLVSWASVLGIPDRHLWFDVPTGVDDRNRRLALTGSRSTGSEFGNGSGDEMHRRELLRMLTLAGALLETSGVSGVDVDRLEFFQEGGKSLDSQALDEFATMNSYLWRAFGAADQKAEVYPSVREHLSALVSNAKWTGGKNHRRLSELTADIFQLAGEIFLDLDDYVNAAQCYTLAGTAAKEAGDFDLWACALTRHAYLAVFDRKFSEALPVLDLAQALALRGNPDMSTRHWVQIVRAETLAGMGDLDECKKALDGAQLVKSLPSPVHNSGWLRFDGSRLNEEIGRCFVELRRPDLAVEPLHAALSQNPSVRRRGVVLVDLAIGAAQNGDTYNMLLHTAAAIDTVRQTKSAVLSRKLNGLRDYLRPFVEDRHVARISRDIENIVVLQEEKGRRT